MLWMSLHSLSDWSVMCLVVVDEILKGISISNQKGALSSLEMNGRRYCFAPCFIAFLICWWSVRKVTQSVSVCVGYLLCWRLLDCPWPFGMILADFVECIGSSAWSLLFSCSPFRHVFGLMHNILVNSLDVVLLVFLACLVMAMAWKELILQ
jgi:hypothetical protein